MQLNKNAIVLVLVVVVASCGRFHKDSGHHDEPHRKCEEREHSDHGDRKEGGRRLTIAPEAVRALGIETARVVRRDVSRTLRLSGQIEFDQNALVHVSPRVASRVVVVRRLLGDDVRKGDVLAELDSLKLGELKLSFLEARTELQLAATTLARQERLRKSKITSEREYLAAKAAHLRARMRLSSKHEMLHLLGLNDDEIRAIRYGAHAPSCLLLRAPIGGRIIRKHLAPGELVRPSDKAYTIADLRKVWAQVDITEDALARVRKGMTARVFARAYPGTSFRGVLTLISSSADAKTRTLFARIVVENHTHAGRRFPLRDKMFVEAELALDGPGKGKLELVVPETAVVRHQSGYLVFVEKGRGVYEARAVVLGARVAGRVAILSGLRGDETIVVVGTFALKSLYAKQLLGGGHSH